MMLPGSRALAFASRWFDPATVLGHGMMGRVKGDFAVDGNSFTYAGAQVRLALSADALQYVVTVVYAAPNYTAAFSDERGVIYTGKALE